MGKKNTLNLFGKVVNLEKEIESQRENATVLFADLAGSTEFKVRHGHLLGLRKTYLHNFLISEVGCDKGKIVKYVGDEVMILFRGKNHAALACKTACAIQQKLKELNSQKELGSLVPIESKIGIHTGEVYYWKYPGFKEDDPQGNTVDRGGPICLDRLS